nr:MAG TPA: hypothetical protein [Caudoviricetes sp.]DAX65896.1 MAG TPA: hypothetical protein [Caudoviricetes sp.]
MWYNVQNLKIINNFKGLFLLKLFAIPYIMKTIF